MAAENGYWVFLQQRYFVHTTRSEAEKKEEKKNGERQNEEEQEIRKKRRRTWSLRVKVATKIYRFTLVSS